MTQNVCCVPGCTTKGGDGIPRYRFPDPLKKKDLFNTWMDRIDGAIHKLDSNYVYQNRRVCRRHFDKVYIYTKKLCPLAVPSLFLSDNTVPDTTQSISSMSPASTDLSLVKTSKTKEILNRCRCCLSTTNLVSICEVHEHYGEKEIYGEMLKECFGLEWPFDIPEMICEMCVSKLREALKFKKVILATQEILKEGFSTLQYTVKVEEVGESDSQVETYEEVEYLDCDTYEDAPTFAEDELLIPMETTWQMKNVTSDTQSIKKEILPSLLTTKLQKENTDTPTIKEEELPSPRTRNLKIENVSSDTPSVKEEDTHTPIKRKRLKRTSDTTLTKQEESPTGKKRKWPKKKIRSERNKTYKQYTQKGLKEAIKLVKAGQMSVGDAANIYGIPKNTLSVKVSNADVKEVDEVKESNSVKHHKLIEEVKTLLTYTNALPFRTRTTRYYCFYCSTDGPTFEEPEELREHTRTAHVDDVENLERYMTPQWMNEVIKFDIDGLQCNLCSLVIPDWNKMFEHFGLVHNIEFDEAYRKVIPYALAAELSCILCNEAFHNYGHLDSHMNSHYPNYICYMCGDTFLAATRLDKHVKVHKVGNYPCEKCDKVFTLEKYRAKHFTLVHVQDSNVKCLYCPAKFLGTFQRHKHVLEKHKDKVKTYTCEVCGKFFTWKPYFFNHMRRKHNAEKEFKCNFCDKTFTRNYELKNHELRHTNDKKIVCGLCGEIYSKMMLFRRHMQTHIDDGPDTENSS